MATTASRKEICGSEERIPGIIPEQKHIIMEAVFYLQNIYLSV